MDIRLVRHPVTASIRLGFALLGWDIMVSCPLVASMSVQWVLVLERPPVLVEEGEVVVDVEVEG